MQFTKNFSLEELCKTDTGIENVPAYAEAEKLMYLAHFILQPTRDRFGALKITSGFRCEEVNAKIGGAKTSQHLFAEAVDIVPLSSDIDMVFDWMKNNLTYGQLIRENKNGVDWIHVSLPRYYGANQQTMSFKDGQYKMI